MNIWIKEYMISNVCRRCWRLAVVIAYQKGTSVKLVN